MYVFYIDVKKHTLQYTYITMYIPVRHVIIILRHSNVPQCFLRAREGAQPTEATW